MKFHGDKNLGNFPKFFLFSKGIKNANFYVISREVNKTTISRNCIYNILTVY